MPNDLAAVTLFTLLTAGAGTAVMIVPGIALGWLLARCTWPGKGVVETLILLPLVVPPVATGLILLHTFGRQGLLGPTLHRLGWNILFSPWAVILAAAIMAFPLFVRAARVAFEAVPRRHEQVARSLGARPWDVWCTITLPLASRGLLAGGVLAYARALGEFGATVMVAGMIPGKTMTLALSIYHQVQMGHDTAAFAYLACSLLLAWGALLLSEILTKRDRAQRPD